MTTTDSGVTDSGVIVTEDGGHVPPDGGPVDVDAGRPDAGVVDAGMPVGCLPNHDGVIERSEVFFQAGLRATFKVSGAATFDTAGGTASDGGKQWDFTQALTGDASRLVETRSLRGEWYESDYPDAGYITELAQGSDLLGVFAATSDGLYLQGVVSPNNDSSVTKIHYEPWVKVLKFPLQAGISWSTDTTVSGKYNGYVIGNAAFGTGLPFQREVYTSEVDRAGDAKTPFATFDSLRVRTKLERYTRVYTLNTWYLALTLRTFNWNSECFGTVATVGSTDNESNTEFTSAKEVRRIAP